MLIIGIAALITAAVLYILMRVQYIKLLQEHDRMKEILGVTTARTSLSPEILEGYGFKMAHHKDGSVGMHAIYSISLWKNQEGYYEAMIQEGEKTWLDKFDTLEDLVDFTIKHGIEIKPTET